MTDREKAIVMAYTGIAMLKGEKINEYYKYLAELYGRPVYTHEIVTLDIAERAKSDFIRLCEETPDKRTETHPCDNQYCIQNGGDICDRVHCPIGHKQTFYDDITDEQEQLDFVQKHERIPVVIKAETHGDVISRAEAIDARRYTFGNDEFSLEAAYHDCKLVFDGITDDDSFQEADTGLILYYANEIIYALQEALEGKDTNVPTNDCISRAGAIDAIRHIEEIYVNNLPTMIDKASAQTELMLLPSAEPEIIRCQYCKHNTSKPGGGNATCELFYGMMDQYGFCHRAERREDEKNNLS